MIYLRIMGRFCLFLLYLISTLCLRLVGRRLYPAWGWFQETVVRFMRWSFGRPMENLDLALERRILDILGALARLRPDKIRLVRQEEEGGPSGEWLIPAELSGEGGPVILYLHGGGYMFCSPVTHRLFITRVARAAGARVLGLRYRLAPEHPFPAALDDAVAGYCWLLERGNSPEEILLAGDSAGGGLALALLKRLRDEGKPLPAGAALLSPWVDLVADDDSMREYAGVDYLGTSVAGSGQHVRLVLGDADPRDPLASPLHGDLSGLPPLLLHAGGVEILRGQIERLARRAREAGVGVELKVWPHMVHVFQSMNGVFPQGREAVREVGIFARRRLGLPNSGTRSASSRPAL